MGTRGGEIKEKSQKVCKNKNRTCHHSKARGKKKDMYVLEAKAAKQGFSSIMPTWGGTNLKKNQKTKRKKKKNREQLPSILVQSKRMSKSDIKTNQLKQKKQTRTGANWDGPEGEQKHTRRRKLRWRVWGKKNDGENKGTLRSAVPNGLQKFFWAAQSKGCGGSKPPRKHAGGKTTNRNTLVSPKGKKDKQKTREHIVDERTTNKTWEGKLRRDIVVTKTASK